MIEKINNLLSNNPSIAEYFKGAGSSDKTDGFNNARIRGGNAGNEAVDTSGQQPSAENVSEGNASYQLSINYEKVTYINKSYVAYNRFSGNANAYNQSASSGNNNDTLDKTATKLSDLIDAAFGKLNSSDSKSVSAEKWIKNFAEKLGEILKTEMSGEVLGDDNLKKVAEKVASFLYDKIQTNEKFNFEDDLKQATLDLLKDDKNNDFASLKKALGFNNNSQGNGTGSDIAFSSTMFQAYQYTEITKESFSLELSVAA